MPSLPSYCLLVPLLSTPCDACHAEMEAMHAYGVHGVRVGRAWGLVVHGMCMKACQAETDAMALACAFEHLVALLSEDCTRTALDELALATRAVSTLRALRSELLQIVTSPLTHLE